MYLANDDSSGYCRLCCGHVVRGAHDHVAYAHVEDVAHLCQWHIAGQLDEREDGRDVPRAKAQVRPGVRRQHADDIVAQAAAGDVRHALDGDGLIEPLDVVEIAAVRFEERVADGPARRLLRRHWFIPPFRRQQAPGQGVAVGVQAGRRQPQENVAGADSRAVNDAVVFDDADDTADKVVVTLGIHAG